MNYISAQLNLFKNGPAECSDNQKITHVALILLYCYVCHVAAITETVEKDKEEFVDKIQTHNVKADIIGESPSINQGNGDTTLFRCYS